MQVDDPKRFRPEQVANSMITLSLCPNVANLSQITTICCSMSRKERASSCQVQDPSDLAGAAKYVGGNHSWECTPPAIVCCDQTGDVEREVIKSNDPLAKKCNQ